MQSFIWFIKEKWWVFTFFLLALFLVAAYEKGSPTEVFLLFVVYSFADFCMILMASDWKQGNVKRATYFHLSACCTFFAIFFYQGLQHAEWHYAWVSILFLLGAIKAYYQNNLERKTLDWFQWPAGTLIQTGLLIALYFAGYGPDKLINWLEAVGMAGFSVVLLMKQRDFQSSEGRRNNWLAIGTIGLLVMSSLFNALSQWQAGHLKGLPIALTLFAFCVWLEFFQGLLKTQDSIN